MVNKIQYITPIVEIGVLFYNLFRQLDGGHPPTNFMKGGHNNMTDQKYRFVSENRGIGKTSGNPYHNLELHDPLTFQNLSFRVDFNTVLAPFNFIPGQEVEVSGVKFVKQYDNTVTLITGLKPVGNK